MEIKIDSLIPFDLLRTELSMFFPVVEKNGKVVLLKDNKPAYIVLKYDVEGIVAENTTEKHANYTLQEAMKISVIRG
jgi:antitoxin Phd